MCSSAKCANTVIVYKCLCPSCRLLTGCWQAAIQERYTCQRPHSQQEWNFIQSSVRAKDFCCRGIKRCWSITDPSPMNGTAIFSQCRVYSVSVQYPRNMLTSFKPPLKSHFLELSLRCTCLHFDSLLCNGLCAPIGRKSTCTFKRIHYYYLKLMTKSCKNTAVSINILILVSCVSWYSCHVHTYVLLHEPTFLSSSLSSSNWKQ